MGKTKLDLSEKVAFYAFAPDVLRFNILKSTKISAKAKVILLLCIEYQNLSISEISLLMKEGSEAINSTIKELGKLNFIEKKVNRENGKITKWFVFVKITNVIKVM
jgi:predicted transcriptional regulator